MSLSIAPAPGLGETFTSWMQRVSAANHYPLASILETFGLIKNQGWRTIGGGYDMTLSAREKRRIGEVTGYGEETISRLTVADYFLHTGLIASTPNRNNLRTWALQNPIRVARSLYCPDCLGENQHWLLNWKNPFTYSCHRHRTLLSVCCPECGWGKAEHSRAGNQRLLFAGRVAKPGHCRAPQAPGKARVGRFAKRCDYPLSKARALETATPTMLTTQQLLQDAQEQGHAVSWWHDLRLLNQIVLAYVPLPLLRELQPGNKLSGAQSQAWKLHTETLAATYLDSSGRSSALSMPLDPLLNATTLPIALESLTNPELARTLVSLRAQFPRQTPASWKITRSKASDDLRRLLGRRKP